MVKNKKIKEYSDLFSVGVEVFKEAEKNNFNSLFIYKADYSEPTDIVNEIPCILSENSDLDE